MKRLAAIVVALFACDRSAASTAIDASSTDSALKPPVEAAVPPAPTLDACGEDLPIVSAKSIGHTSVVYKMTLTDGRKLAWKPNAKTVPNRWRGEVAAYRLGVALAIPNVPPACTRAFWRSAFAGKIALAPEREAGRQDNLIGDPVEGAAIPWIEGLQFMALEKDPLRSKVAGWLSAKSPMPTGDDAALAAQVSTMIVFDAITGNWDRYSGGNVGLDASGKTVLFIDNDAAFMDGPPKEAMKAAQARLDATDRFSRQVIAKLRTLDEAALTSALGPDLLPPSMVATAAKRVQSVLATIDGKRAARPDPDVLVFP